MTPTPKNSRVRTGKGERNGRDHFSTLSDDLLVHILSLLTLKQAISAGMLSRRWRYLWTLTPNLDFFRCSSERFVDRFLIFHRAAKIRAFKIRFVPYARYSDSDSDGDRSGSDDDRFRNGGSYAGHRYDSWLYFAVSRNVEHLAFEVDNSFYQPPPYLFRSKSLTKLELKCPSLALPKFICMPALKCLILSYFSNLSGDDISSFTSGCTSLDSLSLLRCNSNTKLSVVVTNPV